MSFSVGRNRFISKRKREPTMPRGIGGPEKAYDADVTIAAHAICVRTTMLSLAQVCEFPTFSNYKIRITLLIFLKCCGAVITFPTAKLAKIFRMRA